MKKLFVFILLKDPLLVILILVTTKLFDVDPGGQAFRVDNIIGATLFGSISLAVWDGLLLSIPYYYLIRKERLPQKQLFTAGVLLHIPILLIAFVAKLDQTVWSVIISVIVSSSAAGMIYKALAL